MNSPFYKREAAQLLRTFTKEECKAFSAHLQGRASGNVLQLWQQLRLKHPRYSIEDEALYQHIRPKGKYNDKAYRQWVSELYSHAKHFVAIQEFENNKAMYGNVLSMALLRRGAKKGYEKVIREQRNLIAGEQQPNVDYFLYRYQMEDVHYQYVTVHDHRKATNSLQLAADYHDVSFLVHKLKYLFAMHNRERIVNVQYRYPMKAEILAILDAAPREDVPLLHLYYLLVKQMSDLGDRNGFLAFMRYIKQEQNNIGIKELRQFLTSAINICYWNIQLGRKGYVADRFELAKMMVAGEHAIVEGYFPHYHFRNIMRIAVEAGELDWAAAFLLNNLNKTRTIPKSPSKPTKKDKKTADKPLPDHRHNLKVHNYALLHFAKKDYAAQAPYMLKMISDFHFIDINNELAFRLLELKTDYELLGENPDEKDIKSFKRKLDNFRNFLKYKKKISAVMLVSLEHFRKGLNLLFLSRYGKKKMEQDVEEGIQGFLPMEEYVWLSEQVELWKGRLGMEA